VPNGDIPFRVPLRRQCWMGGAVVLNCHTQCGYSAPGGETHFFNNNKKSRPAVVVCTSTGGTTRKGCCKVHTWDLSGEAASLRVANIPTADFHPRFASSLWIQNQRFDISLSGFHIRRLFRHTFGTARKCWQLRLQVPRPPCCVTKKETTERLYHTILPPSFKNVKQYLSNAMASTVPVTRSKLRIKLLPSCQHEGVRST
jgi:hypothetical protein